MSYLLGSAGLAVLVAVAVAWYSLTRARADRADRDAALGRAAAASDLASRLQTSLDALRAAQDKELADAEQAARRVSGARDAGAFLRDSTGVLPSHTPGPAQGNLSSPPIAGARVFVTGFGRRPGHRD